MDNNLQTNIKRFRYQFWNIFLKVIFKAVMNMPAVLGLFGAFDILTCFWPFCIAQRVENSWCENNCFLMHVFFPTQQQNRPSTRFL